MSSIRSIRTVLMVALTTAGFAQGGTIRDVVAGPNDIVTVRTALGLSTMIELPNSPKSVVAGDMDAFRVEYSGQALAIKPVLAGAKSNLFVATARGDFRFQLLVVDPGSADYVIRIKPKKRDVFAMENIPSKAPVSSGTLGKVSQGPLGFTILGNNSYGDEKRIGFSFMISATPEIANGQSARIQPDEIHIFQGDKDLPLHLVALESQEVSASKPIAGLVVIDRELLGPKGRVTVAFCPRSLGGCEQGLRVLLPTDKPLQPKGKNREKP